MLDTKRKHLGPLLNLSAEIGKEQLFFKVEKEGKSLWALPNGSKWMIVRNVIKNLNFYRLGEKWAIFVIFAPQHSLFQTI